MNPLKTKIKLTVEKTDTGFSAYAVDHPLFTTGRTIPELIDNALEAAQLYYEEENLKVAHDDLQFEIDFQQFGEQIS